MDNSLLEQFPYNVLMKQDKILEKLSEPEIIKGRKLPRKKVHIKWEEDYIIVKDYYLVIVIFFIKGIII